MGRVWLQPQKPTPDSDNTMSPSWQGPCHQAQVMLRQLYGFSHKSFSHLSHKTRRPPILPPELDHEPDLSVLLVTPAVTEPGPEGGAGAGAAPALWIPYEPVTLGTRTAGKLSVTFLNKVTLVLTSCSI